MRAWLWIAISMLALPASAQEVEVGNQFVKSKFLVDKDRNTVDVLSTQVDYTLGFLNYKGDYVKNTKIHDLTMSLQDVKLSYREIEGSAPVSTFMFEAGKLKFANTESEFGQMVQILNSKFLSKDSTVLSYADGKASATIAQHSNDDAEATTVSMKTDAFQANYVESDAKVATTNYWKQPVSTSTYLDFSTKNLSLKLMDDYSEFASSFGPLSMRYIDADLRSETALSYVDSRMALSYEKGHAEYGLISQVFNSKYVYNDNESFSLKFGARNLSYSRFASDVSNVTQFAYQSPEFTSRYMSGNADIAVTDYWKKPVYSKTYFDIGSKNYYFRLMDNYNEFSANMGAYTFRNISGENRAEIGATQKTKDYNWSVTSYDSETGGKDFVNFANKQFELKSALDGNLSVNMLRFGNTVLAQSDKQSYIQSAIGALGYRLSSDSDYELKYGNIGVRNDNLMFSLPLSKGLLATGTWDTGLDTLSYVGKLYGCDVDFRYTNRFTAFDFYFNQNVFSVYDNNFDLIGSNKTPYKKASSLKVANGKVAFAGDIINDLYNFSFKLDDKFNTGYLKDQKRHLFNLSYADKFGSINVAYDVNKRRYDKFQIVYSVRF